MSFSIEKGESLAKAFGRIAAEEINVAMAELCRPDRGEAVHNARKAMKRVRALLRSLRVAFPKKYRAENERIAKAARKMSPVRDLHVQLRTLGKLKAATGPLGQQVRRELLRKHTSIVRKIPNLRETVRAMLDDSRQSLASWPFAHANADYLVVGLKRIYKQGREALKVARASATPSRLHEWRKKAKSLGYGLELIEGIGPGKMSRMKRCSEQLSEALGDDHDLFMVLHALRLEHRDAPAPDFAPLAKRIADKRATLQKRAFKLGKKLYAEKPGCFEQRLDRYLRRARKEKRLT